MTNVWKFSTSKFVVRARIVDDCNTDLSWADQETLDAIASGRYVAFGTIVEVVKNGHVIGESSLWGNIYEDVAEFFHAHRTSPAEGRNTLALKAERKAICHYFPDLVREAIQDARNTLATDSHA